MILKSGVSVFAVSLILTVLLNEANALRCWYCASDASGGEYCADPFSPERLTTQQKMFAYPECEPSNNVGVRPVCKKLIEKIKGHNVTKRSCFYEDSKDSSKQCIKDTKDAAPNEVEVLFCETCLTDGCNGAAEFAPAATISLLPVIIAKCFTW